MKTKRQRDVRFLKAYSLLITVLLAVYAFSAPGRADEKGRFDEIDVGRIRSPAGSGGATLGYERQSAP